jgi:dimeric dUTPase (all-alpha-NTP-PPase superfamily)
MELERAREMLATMATMQEEHNLQVHPDWRENGYEYYRAIWVECAEMLDHYGWKWWKKQDADMSQVKLELVDIWHFGLSEMLRADQLSDEVAVQLGGVGTGDGDAETFRQAIESLAASSLRTKSFELEPFKVAMQTLPITYEELFSMYVGKNILNRFRQDNGYKTGEYRKLWSGREDNEHLVELLDELVDDAVELPQRLYAALQLRYQSDT